MKVMPLALLISSHVAASMVGGGVGRLVLNDSGIDTMLVPTVIYGRHPGWGAPGGAVVEPGVMRSMLDGIEAQGLHHLTDLVLTGYFASPQQVFEAARAIDLVRRGDRSHAGQAAFAATPLVVVDPVMGDAPDGLYVSPQVATAIREQLLPRADLVTPNAFELGYLTGRSLTDLASMIRAARSLGSPALVTSLPRHGRIGVMYVAEDEAWMVTHDRCPMAPRGTGDLLAAAFAAVILNGTGPKAALEHAVAATVSVVMRANEWGATEMPLVAAAGVLRAPLIELTAETL